MKIENINNKEIGYVLGLLAGDGYMIHDKKSRHYNVEFYLNSIRDKKIIEFISILLNRMELIVQRYLDKRFNCLRIRASSKELYNFIKGDIFKENDDFKIGFISGFIDSDGYYNKKKSTLVITNSNIEKLKKTKRYLEDLKVSSSLNKKFKGPTYKIQPYNLYISVKFISIDHLSQKIKAA
jgi:intein/homing endonuclease